MRTYEEIMRNPRARKVPTIIGRTLELNLKEGRFLAVFGMNEDGWEHVSVSPRGDKRERVQPCPTWEQMCAVKRFFWRDAELVVQLHPPEDAYFHGPGFDTNILHLWRPADGDWSRLAEKEGA